MPNFLRKPNSAGPGQALQEFIDAVEGGVIKVNFNKRFQLDQIAKAHVYMESNQAKGKIVVEV